jgi:hypothetical protein
MAANWTWAGLLLLGALYELYALVNGMPGDTLSERIRAWCAVHTQPGRAIFLAGWITFATWFAVHIVWHRP